MKYFKIFNNHTDYESYINSENVILPNLSFCNETENQHIHSEAPEITIDWSTLYFRTTAIDNGTISFNISDGINTDGITSISYSTNNGQSWTTVQNEDDKEDYLVITVNVSAGDSVLWKGTAEYLSHGNNSFFTSTAHFNVDGNIMSLLYGDNFIGETTLEYSGIFEYLFYDPNNDIHTLVVNAENLCLPATTITPECYRYMFVYNETLKYAPKILPALTLEGCYECYYEMFMDCVNLIAAPELPATILADSCYHEMFSGCENLTKAPSILPVTSVAESCCYYMFSGCINLTTAPELPATTLAEGCYYEMFMDCINLTTAPELPATTLAEGCYDDMFHGCTGLTMAPELPAITLVEYCYSSMFSGCTSLTIAPKLPATTLANGCYSFMFYGCTGLTTSPELPATTLAYNCYNNMFAYTNVLPDTTNIDFTSQTVVASGGLAGLFAGTKITDNDLNNILPKNNNNKYCLPVTILTNGCYENMFRECMNLTIAPELPATTLANRCYGDMFNGCTNLTKAPELPVTTLTTSCYSGMFKNCVSLIKAPELPATTLAEWCYSYMFSGCINLTTAPELPATSLANNCYSDMFYGCTSLTIAPILPAIRLVSHCYDNMFINCINLRYICSMYNNATQLGSSYSLRWVTGVATNGTFITSDDLSSIAHGVSWIPQNWYWHKETMYEYMYLTFKPFSNTTFKFSNAGLSYSTNNGETWTELPANTSTPTINANQTIMWKGELISDTANGIGTFSSSDNKSFDAYGNIMSLLYGDSFIGKKDLIGKPSVFKALFENSQISYANNLILPALTLSANCYDSMFKNSSVSYIPELPATTLTDSCYAYMFSGCEDLYTPQEILPAEILAEGCYTYMFSGCINLEQAPKLPATTLAVNCYYGMFEYCSDELNTAPILPALTLVSGCYERMFTGCGHLKYIKAMFITTPSTSYTNDWVSDVYITGTFVKNSAAQWNVAGVNGIPSGWTIETANE